MKKIMVFGLMILALAACSSVMFTGRRQVKLISGSEMRAMAVQSYDQFLNENKISTNEQYSALLQTVGAKLRVAVEAYMTQNGYAEQISSFDWQFNLVESDEVNAWAMPGGKVVFYTGIMPICENEQGVATVMGHEIAHVLAQHGNERMSHEMVAQYGGIAFSEFVKNKPAQTQQLYNSAFALGTQYGALLPYSRLHESEADKIGQIIMAMAGYDPAYAVVFWKKMSEMSTNASVPEFMSTHPSNATRIKLLTDNIEAARAYAKKEK